MTTATRKPMNRRIGKATPQRLPAGGGGRQAEGIFRGALLHQIARRIRGRRIDRRLVSRQVSDLVPGLLAGFDAPAGEEGLEIVAGVVGHSCQPAVGLRLAGPRALYWGVAGNLRRD